MRPRITTIRGCHDKAGFQFTELQAKHRSQFAEDAGLAKSLLRKRVLELARELPEKAHGLWADPREAFHKSVIVEHVVALIQQRSALTIRRLHKT
jgi:serine/threonine-protein kinase HipA